MFDKEQFEQHGENETVFEHLMLAVDSSVGITDDTLLRLAAAFHDVGKPASKVIDADGQARFIGHEHVGADIVADWMREMKFTSSQVAEVTGLVDRHQVAITPASKDKAIRKWLHKTGKDWKRVLALRNCDMLGNLARCKDDTKRNCEALEAKCQAQVDSGAPLFAGELAVTGKDLKGIGVKPGPVFQDIFKELWGMVLGEPHRNTKEGLLGFVKKTRLGG